MQDHAVFHKYAWPSRFRQQLPGGACPTIVEPERDSSSIPSSVGRSDLLNATSRTLLDSDDAELAIAALEGARMLNKIVSARAGEEVPRHLFEEQVHPLLVVVLLDLKTPRVDGLDILERIRSENRTRALPVLVLTSSKENRDISACNDLGVNSYIVKPADFEHFASRVRQFGLYWVVLNMVPPV